MPLIDFLRKNAAAFFRSRFPFQVQPFPGDAYELLPLILTGIWHHHLFGILHGMHVPNLKLRLWIRHILQQDLQVSFLLGYATLRFFCV